MGTDIHLYIEYKDKNGKWVLDENQICKECNGVEASFGDDICCPYCYGDGYISHDINRNYILFSILADVRNEYNITPISEQRGIPDDASKEYIKIAKNDPQDHSHSYHTLRQLKEYKSKDNKKEEYNIYFLRDEYNWEYIKIHFPTALQELADKHGGDENVRIVFFFDN